jgi:hypothetical protein
MAPSKLGGDNRYFKSPWHTHNFDGSGSGCLETTLCGAQHPIDKARIIARTYNDEMPACPLPFSRFYPSQHGEMVQ